MRINLNEYLEGISKIWEIREDYSINSEIDKHIISLKYIFENKDLYSLFDYIKENGMSMKLQAIDRMLFEMYIRNNTRFTSNIVEEAFCRQSHLFRTNELVYISKMLKDNGNNRMLGNDFQKHIKTWAEYRPLNQFKDEEVDTFLITVGDDNKLKEYAEEQYNIKLDKGIDAIAKTKNKVYLIESKLVMASGGSQNHQIKDALNVARIKTDLVEGIALLDGSIYLDPTIAKKELRKELEKDNVISVLELRRFINERH